MTDFHGYNTPKRGAVNWDGPLNENFRQIDEDMEVRDVDANLSAYNPKDGAKFFATDTGNVYIGDGSNWNQINIGGNDHGLLNGLADDDHTQYAHTDGRRDFTGSVTFLSGLTSNANLDMGSNLIQNLADPTVDTEAANKGYVDAVAQGLDVKDSARVATESNIDLTAATDPNPVDGVTLSNGDRVLLKSQTTGSENGIYEAVTATDPTTWVRTDDADVDSEVTAGLFTFVEEGTVNADTGFVLTTDDPITVGTTSLSFSAFSGASVTAGDGLLKSGDTLSVDEAFSFIWSSSHTFSAGADFNGDIVDGATLIYDSSLSQIEQDALENDSVTIAGNLVALGGSTAINHADLSTISANDHHNQIQFSNGGTAVLTQPTDVNAGTNVSIEDDGDGTITISASSGGSVNISDDGTQVVSGVSDIDFTGGHFSVTNPVGSDADVVLTNDSVTVTSGDGLKGGGTVALGGSTTLNIEPLDFAGTFLSDDGVDNLTVNISTGLENDGTGSIRLDEDYAATWTTTQTFNAGLNSNGQLELSDLLKVNGITEPATPTSGNVVYTDSADGELKVKDSAGTVQNIGDTGGGGGADDSRVQMFARRRIIG